MRFKSSPMGQCDDGGSHSIVVDLNYQKLLRKHLSANSTSIHSPVTDNYTFDGLHCCALRICYPRSVDYPLNMRGKREKIRLTHRSKKSPRDCREQREVIMCTDKIKKNCEWNVFCFSRCESLARLMKNVGDQRDVFKLDRKKKSVLTLKVTKFSRYSLEPDRMALSLSRRSEGVTLSLHFTLVFVVIGTKKKIL